MRRAVLVASSRYKDAAAFPPLRFPVSDAKSLRDVLLDPNSCFFDEAALIADGTVAEALRALESSARASEREDLLLFIITATAISIATEPWRSRCPIQSRISSARPRSSPTS
jgi:hypothetical protein